MQRTSLWAVFVALASTACTGGSDDPIWLKAFGYSPSSALPFEVREFGYPFVPVEIGGNTLWIPFDTGNMAGLTLASDEFHRWDLPCSEEWDRLDSAGDVVSTGCAALGVEAAVFGVRRESLRVLEFFHESLPGLVGPDLLPGTRFTMDYRSLVFASDSSRTPLKVPGFVAIPLLRSERHPRLILVEGEVNGSTVLFELDTGKSRTTIDRALVEELALQGTQAGVPIERVRLGPREWRVGSARVVSTSGTSEGLPHRISLGVGSDILRSFVFTVDYAAGLLWVETPTPTSGTP